MLTAQVATLTAWNGTDALVYQTLVSGQDECRGGERGRWRVVELFSQSSAPFEARVTWTAGNGGSRTALVTVARATRIGIYARSIDVQVANLDDATNTVGGTVAPARSFVQTHNQYEVRGESAPHAALVEVPIPPFATVLHFSLSDYTNAATWGIAVTDAQGTLRAFYTADALPPGGIPVGGAGKIEVSSGANTGNWRSVFDLQL